MPQKKTFKKPEGNELEKNYQSKARYYTRHYRDKRGRTIKTVRSLKPPKRKPTPSLRYTNWEIYQHNAPPKGQLANLVVVLRARRGKMIYIAKGYSPRVIHTKANRGEMFERAYNNALANIGTSYSGLRVVVTDMYYNRWSRK